MPRWLVRVDALRPSERVRDLVTARYPIGPEDTARASVKFAWRSETEDVTAAMDILLQLVVDSTTEALMQCESSWAPLAVPQTLTDLESRSEAVKAY